jgi:hypothetical protein
MMFLVELFWVVGVQFGGVRSGSHVVLCDADLIEMRSEGRGGEKGVQVGVMMFEWVES